MNTGEDTQSLRKIIEFTRLISIFILSIHFYMSCYMAFRHFGWTADITDRIILNISKTGLFDNLFTPKIAALVLLIISLFGIKGRKDEKIRQRDIVMYLVIGFFLYFISVLAFYLVLNSILLAVIYIGLTTTGYMLILTGGGLLSRMIKTTLNQDIFNSDNETFPQEERLLENEYSINLPATYNLKGKIRKSYINFINPFRGLLISGTPGSR